MNVELLDKTLNYVLNHPDEWKQDVWHCGSTGCFAYWACVLSGEPMEFVEGLATTAEKSQWLKCVEGETAKDHRNGHDLTTIPDRATRLLGLTVSESMAIFHSCGTKRAIKEAVEDVKEGVYR